VAVGRRLRNSANVPAIAPGAPRRGRGPVSATSQPTFVQVTRTLAAPFARVLIPDHPPLRFGWSGTGAASCADSVRVVV
jgi:hypothetical protein